jgi:hypothetical protein
MGADLSFRCEARRREHGGWTYWIYAEDDPRESSLESYPSEHDALIAGCERMQQLQQQHAPIKGQR